MTETEKNCDFESEIRPRKPRSIWRNKKPQSQTVKKCEESESEAETGEGKGKGDFEERTEKRKLVLVGDSKCGKTCLVKAWMKSGPCKEIHEPTVFDNYSATVCLSSTRRSQKVKLDLWDTAGLDRYDGLRPFSLQNAHAIILCFAIDSPSSFTNVLQRWHPQLCHYCPTVPIVLVGVKHDPGHPLSSFIPISGITLQTRSRSDSIDENENSDDENHLDLEINVIHEPGPFESQNKQKQRQPSRSTSIKRSIWNSNSKSNANKSTDADTEKNKSKSKIEDKEKHKIGNNVIVNDNTNVHGNGHRQVTLSRGQGQALAMIINAATYIECSPTTHSGVNQVFNRAANLAFKYGKGKRKKEGKTNTKCSVQ